MFKFPHVNDLKRQQQDKTARQVASFEDKVKHYLEQLASEHLLKTDYNYVNVAVPNFAYANLNDFEAVCKKLLAPLGYTKVMVSHDGGGMYNTLLIIWDKE